MGLLAANQRYITDVAGKNRRGELPELVVGPAERCGGGDLHDVRRSQATAVVQPAQQQRDLRGQRPGVEVRLVEDDTT